MQKSLKRPLLPWITGGEILHPVFYFYLPSGLLLLCGTARVFSSAAHPPLLECLTVGVRGRRKAKVCEETLVCSGCASRFMHICVRTCRISLHVLFPKRLCCTCSKATGLIDHATRAFLSELLAKC